MTEKDFAAEHCQNAKRKKLRGKVNQVSSLRKYIMEEDKLKFTEEHLKAVEEIEIIMRNSELYNGPLNGTLVVKETYVGHDYSHVDHTYEMSASSQGHAMERAIEDLHRTDGIGQVLQTQTYKGNLAFRVNKNWGTKAFFWRAHGSDKLHDLTLDLAAKLGVQTPAEWKVANA